MHRRFTQPRALFARATRRGLAALAALMLASTLIPLAPAHALEANPVDVARETRIQALLQGDFVEGRVLVSVLNDAGNQGRTRSLSEGATLLASAQDLLDVSADAEAAPTNGNRAPLTRDAEAPTETIKLIESPTLSTEDLLRALIDEPGVTAAEPDYIGHIEQPEATPLSAGEYAARAQSQAAPAANALASSSTGQPDLTPLQWQYQPKNAASTHIPGWDARADQNMGENVYVAVLDSGVDYEHPDLQGAFSPLPHVSVGNVEGGDFGIDLIDDDNDPRDTENGHGTHCAGIIAATWNDGGTSGAASGAKLVAVRVGDAGGLICDSSAIQGYAYLKELIGQGIPVRVANNSWGGAVQTTMLSKAVSELGRCGMVSVFSAGNEGEDTVAAGMGNALLSADPYSITVGSSDELGNPNVWSSYSSQAVDVCAPGSRILSTFPTALSGYVGDSGTPIYHQGFESGTLGDLNFTRSGGSALSPTVSAEVHRENALSSPSTTSGHSVALDIGTFAGQPGATSAAVHVLIPRHEVQGATAGSVHVAMRGSNRAVSATAYYLNGTGLASSELLEVLPGSPSSSEQPLWTELAAVFPAISGEDGDIEVDIALRSDDGQPLDGTLYVDDVSFAGPDAQVPYAYMSGTSMAAPVISGATAVLMAREGYNGQTAADAALAAATIAGSVEQKDAYADRCISSGTFDFDDTENPVPVVRSASFSDGTLDIEGYFFGDGQGARGRVTVASEDGGAVEAAGHVSAWSDREVKVEGVAILPGEVTVRVYADRDSGQSQAFGRQTRVLVEPGDQYQTDLTSTLPHDQSFSWFTGEALTGLGGVLYRTAVIGHPDMEGYPVDTLWAFDTATRAWTSTPLPAALAQTPCDGALETCAWRGRLLLRCVASPYATSDQSLWAFDPATGSWEQMAPPPPEVSPQSSMAVLGDDLVFVGGLSVDEETGIPSALASIRAWDPETGATSVQASLACARVKPLVRSDASTLAVYGGSGFDDYDMHPLTSIELLHAGDASTTPASAQPFGALPFDVGVLGLSPTRDGVAFLGSVPAGEPDTFVLPPGAQTAEAFPLRFCPTRVNTACALAYEGQLYVLGVSVAADGAHLFRATAMSTVHDPNTDLRGQAPDQPPVTPENAPTPAGLAPRALAATGDALLPQTVLLVALGALGAAGVGLARRATRRLRD